MPDSASADPAGLPIDETLPRLVESLHSHHRCLLVAQPGAGKTTRAPLALLRQSGGSGRWLLLEPRRVAARLAAGYMAEQLGESVGATVGYRVRGESKVGRDTRLEVITQGILIRMLQDDPLLEGVDGIIFDEFHERSLDADLGLAMVLDVQNGLRDDLKLLVMSATLDVASLLAVLGRDTPVIDCPGRTWPVTLHYRPAAPREDAADHQTAVVREALSAGAGDILVFLPGAREINHLYNKLSKRLGGDIGLDKLHGQLPLAHQRRVLQPPPSEQRRVILSSAVAESSITVPGVRTVIDAGRERVPVFQPRSGLTRLETRQVNRASADQRAGRAGREAAGTCYRLWSEALPLVDHREPEILQADLAGLAYELLRWGTASTDDLSWVTPVPKPAFQRAMALLRQLGIADKGSKLTALGKRCQRWPTHPRLAALLDHAHESGDLGLACWLVALMEEAPASSDPDIQQLLDRRDSDAPVLKGWQQTARQWARRLGTSPRVADCQSAAALLAVAYPDRLAQNRGAGKFRLVGGGQALMAETHRLARSPFLVITDLDGRAAGARIFSAIALAAADIEALFPVSREWRVDSRWDDASGRLINEEVRGVGQVELARRPAAGRDPAATAAALLDAVRRRGTLNWSAADRQLLGRLRLVAATLGAPWPALDDDALMATLDQWLGPHLRPVTSLSALDALPLGQYILHTLPWELQRQLDEFAPTHFRAPSGSRIAIDYSGEEPVLAVKLQEMFGQSTTPTVVNGRIALSIHLLSPARRPVQVTRDLANFWASTYYEVRKDLKGRYPKHPWPDDPLTAQATRHTRRRG